MFSYHSLGSNFFSLLVEVFLALIKADLDSDFRLKISAYDLQFCLVVSRSKALFRLAQKGG
jgi:hypothetical protein